MGGRYQLWFDVLCLHSYFRDGVCRPLRFSPSAACLGLLQRYRLQWRPVPGGVQVYYDPDEPLQLLAQFDETLPFSFILHNEDAALLACTAGLPALAGDGMAGPYCFDNRSGAATVSKGSDGLQAGQSLLHAPGQPFGASPLALRPSRFLLRATQAGAQLSIRAGSATVWAATGGGDLAVDLAGRQEGHYRLLSGDATVLDFYLSEAVVAARPWGVVEIHARPQGAPGVYPLDEGGAPLPRHYRIALESLRCTWCYWLVASKKATDKPRGSIKVNGTLPDRPAAALAFQEESAAEALQVDGLPAARFVSNLPLPLAEEPDRQLSFAFAPGVAGLEKDTKRNLPYARASSLVHASGPERVLRAEMYVYL